MPNNMIEKKLVRKEGLTFIEVLVSSAILFIGIVTIFKALLLSFDYIQQLKKRSYANLLLDNRLALMQRMYKVNNAIPFDVQSVETKVIDNKKVNYHQTLEISEVEDLSDIFSLRLKVMWKGKSSTLNLQRSTYISNFDELQ